MKQTLSIEKIIFAILLAAPVILLLLVLRSPNYTVYDEHYFVPNIPLLGQYGLSAKFLNALEWQSPGPLYELIYYPLKYIGVNNINGYRIVNFLMLLGTVYFVYRLMKFEGVKDGVFKALLLFIIPLAWATGGLAITEVPAIFFGMFSLFVLRTAFENNRGHMAKCILAGLLLGLSVIGRTPFLMVIPAAGYLFLKVKGMKKISIILFMGFASIFPILCFVAWKGLVPPQQQQIQSGVNFLFLGYTFSYTCFFMLILYPRLYLMPRMVYFLLAGVLVILFVLNVGIFHEQFMPLQSLNKLIPARFRDVYQHYFSLFMPCVMLTVALLHVVAIGFEVKKSWDNTWMVFLLIATTFIALTTVKSSHEFSTRYPYQGIPCLLIYCAKDIKFSRGLLIRATLGICVGISSLLAYYHLKQ